MKLGELIRNTLTSRQAWLRTLLDPRRDIDYECGHPEVITIQDYCKAFQRGDIAQRIVKIFPEESWCENPEVFETEDETKTPFEQAWDDLEKKLRIYSHLQRVDVLSGVGRFGALLLGISDGKELREPVDGISEMGLKVGNAQHQLLYLRPFDEGLVSIKRLETRVANPRYGQPLEYEIQFVDSSLGMTPDSGNKAVMSSSVVHWSRIIHVADNRTNSDVFGNPRMEVVFDRLLDLKKIAGGSGEMFWKGGFPGLSLETNPGDGEEIEIDKEATKEQMDAYMNGLQRYIALVGMQAKSLSPQVADPTAHIEAQVRLIAMALSVPWRILMGVEVGQLASEQDIRVWNRRISRRREEYLTPFVISPLVERLIAFGTLPEPGKDGFQVEWSDLNAPSDENKATVAEKRTNALAKYVQGGVDTLVPPFHYLTLVLDFSDEEAQAIIDAAGGELAIEEGLNPEPPPEPTLPGARQTTRTSSTQPR